MHSVLMCMYTVCMFSTGIPIDVVNVNVCIVHNYVRLYRCTYMTMWSLLVKHVYIQNCMYVRVCAYAVISIHVILVCTYLYNCSLCTCGLPVPTSCVMHCWLSALYRTGLIKDLLLCSGYRDSSSLRPS